MTVIVMENGSARLRGELTRWLLEAKPGVYVGKVSAMVRERLWAKITDERPTVHALILYSAQNEQGFTIEMHGDPRRQVVDLDGIQLIKFINADAHSH